MKNLSLYMLSLLIDIPTPDNPLESREMTIVITSATAYRTNMANDVLSEKDEKDENARLRRIFNTALATKFKDEVTGDPRVLKIDAESAEKEETKAFLPFVRDKKSGKWRADPGQLLEKLREWNMPLSDNGAFLTPLENLTTDYFTYDTEGSVQKWFRAPLAEVPTQENKPKNKNKNSNFSVLHSVLIEWGTRKHMEAYVKSLSTERIKTKDKVELTDEEVNRRISSVIYNRHFETVPIQLVKFKYTGAKGEEKQVPQTMSGLYLVRHRAVSNLPRTVRTGYLAYNGEDDKGNKVTYFIELEKFESGRDGYNIELYGNCFTSEVVADFVDKGDLACRACQKCHLVPTSEKAGKNTYSYKFNIDTTEDSDDYPQKFTLLQKSTFTPYVLVMRKDEKLVTPPFGQDKVIVLRATKTDTGAPSCERVEFSGVPMFKFGGEDDNN